MSYRATFLFLVMGLAATTGVAQDFPIDPIGGSASVRGRVTNMEGRALADARVEVSDITTGATVRAGYSSASGTFELYNIPRGRYEIVVTHGLSEGRERFELAGAETTINVRLPLAADSSVGGAHSVSVAEMKLPGKVRKLIGKASEAIREGKTDEAMAKLNQALETYPEAPEALRLRAILNLDAGQYDPALADVEKALELNPADATAFTLAAAIHNARSDYANAIRAAERGAGLAPSMWQAYFELSKAQLGKGDFEAAMRSLSRAETMAPKDYSTVHLVKAHALLGLKQYSAAVSAFEAYLAADPKGAAVNNVQQSLNQVRAFLAQSDSVAGRK